MRCLHKDYVNIDMTYNYWCPTCGAMNFRLEKHWRNTELFKGNWPIPTSIPTKKEAHDKTKKSGSNGSG